MKPYWSDDTTTLYLGKAEHVLPTLADASVDAIVTDPPAAIAFMGRTWDHNRGGRAKWVAWLTEVLTEATRCLKPGGHALIWALPRTSHWTAWAIEDAGLDIRDCVLHLFGSGFPKSLDVGRAIDKAAGAEREVTGVKPGHEQFAGRSTTGHLIAGEGHDGWTRPWAASADADRYHLATAPATEDAARWEGWGTALKPGQEMWWLARKPFKGPVAANVLEHGTGALNIDGCRTATDQTRPKNSVRKAHDEFGTFKEAGGGARSTGSGAVHVAGRWPTNVVFSHLPECGPRDATPCVEGCAVAELDRQSGITRDGVAVQRNRSGVRPASVFGTYQVTTDDQGYGGIGGASRFFPVFRYQAKAPASERPKVNGVAHETVKPLALMRWLTRLITPPGGTVLDPFLGSGTTAEACALEGFRCVGIEREEKYVPLIRARLAKPMQPGLGFDGQPAT